MFEIKRKIFTPLKKHLKKQEISMIVGPRQAGKTTIMLLLQDYLEKSGQKTLFLNLDNESDRRFFSSQDAFLSKLRLEFGGEGGIVFIDEIQRREDAGLFLKGIYDGRIPQKLVVSGSGSVELKERIHESLAGRKLLFHLDTLSFEEFLDFRTGYKYEGMLADFCDIEKEGRLPGLFDEYLSFGGYPRVVLSETAGEKARIIDEIYGSYLIKDISYLLKVEKMDALRDLFRVLSSQVGQLINYSELSSVVGISQETLKNYLSYAEKTFVVARIPPFHRNPRKEIVKSPCAYFTDIGLRNYCAGDFGRPVGPSAGAGFVFQNFIYVMLRGLLENTNRRIMFWRTKEKAEVDFIVEGGGGEIVPIEVKFAKMGEAKVKKSLRSFITKYKPKRALVVNLSLDDVIQIDGSDVLFLPYWRLLDLALLSRPTYPAPPSCKIPCH